MRAVVLAVMGFVLPAAGMAADQKPATCPRGETIQWIADYCMAKIGTDDEIAASG